MDDFEREMLIFYLQADADAYDAEQTEKQGLYPTWWNITHGVVDAPKKLYDESLAIMDRFKNFHPALPTQNIFELFKLFEAQTLRN